MIDLYTASTPNGWKVSITLEELNIPYNIIPIDLVKGCLLYTSDAADDC